MGTNHVEVRDAGHGFGKGLFATKDLSYGDFIAEYTGKKITSEEADALKDNRYLFEIDSEWTLDGSDESNIARYINHSCNPNAEGDVMDGHILISAFKSIPKGTEITIDYGDEYIGDFMTHKCLCGTPECRSPAQK